MKKLNFTCFIITQELTTVNYLYRCSIMVLEGSCQKVPLGEPNDSGQWRKTVEPYIAETECWRDGIVWCWVGGIGRGAGGWWENEVKSALTSSRMVLLDVPTGLEARHSYLWEDQGWLNTLFMNKNNLVKSELYAWAKLWNTAYFSPKMSACITDLPTSTTSRKRVTFPGELVLLC